MIRLYFEIHPFNLLTFQSPNSIKDTKYTVVDCDTFTAAAAYSTGKEFNNPCCLNFASHKRPGGGYRSVIDLPMPIRTQEEDLFRRSNLPELMDNPIICGYYPLRERRTIYCSNVIVYLDNCLNRISPFEVSVITIPAIVNPGPEDLPLVKARIQRILDVAADQKHENLILGAWGCDVFNNDPLFIAQTFKDFLCNEFDHVFENVVFAIPGKDSKNHKVFKDVFEKI